jgi:hypothetical protein
MRPFSRSLHLRGIVIETDRMAGRYIERMGKQG